MMLDCNKTELDSAEKSRIKLVSAQHAFEKNHMSELNEILDEFADRLREQMDLYSVTHEIAVGQSLPDYLNDSTLVSLNKLKEKEVFCLVDKPELFDVINAGLHVQKHNIDYTLELHPIARCYPGSSYGNFAEHEHFNLVLDSNWYKDYCQSVAKIVAKMERIEKHYISYVNQLCDLYAKQWFKKSFGEVYELVYNRGKRYKVVGDDEHGVRFMSVDEGKDEYYTYSTLFYNGFKYGVSESEMSIRHRKIDSLLNN